MAGPDAHDLAPDPARSRTVYVQLIRNATPLHAPLA